MRGSGPRRGGGDSAERRHRPAGVEKIAPSPTSRRSNHTGRWLRHRCARSAAVHVCPATTPQCVPGDPLHTAVVPQPQTPLTRVSETSSAAPQAPQHRARTLSHVGTAAYHTPLSAHLGARQRASRTPSLYTSVDDGEPVAPWRQGQSLGASLISIGVGRGGVYCQMVQEQMVEPLPVATTAYTTPAARSTASSSAERPSSPQYTSILCSPSCGAARPPATGLVPLMRKPAPGYWSVPTSEWSRVTKLPRSARCGQFTTSSGLCTTPTTRRRSIASFIKSWAFQCASFACRRSSNSCQWWALPCRVLNLASSRRGSPRKAAQVSMGLPPVPAVVSVTSRSLVARCIPSMTVWSPKPRPAMAPVKLYW